MVETPPVVPRSNKRKDSESVSSRSSIIEARRSIHLADSSELEVVPDLTNFRPVTLTVSSFFKQVPGSNSYLLFNVTSWWWYCCHFSCRLHTCTIIVNSFIIYFSNFLNSENISKFLCSSGEIHSFYPSITSC